MKILIAMDSFKNCISAFCACKIIEETLRSIHPNFKIISIPLADGGEGTAEVLMTARGGQWVDKLVTGPLPEMKVKAGFVYFKDTKTAMVEMAKASGLELLNPAQLNPLKTTTFGTGELIKEAAEYGAKNILLGVGGSATVDGGVGAAQAIGWKFLDADNKDIGFGGGELKRIVKITRQGNLNLPKIEVLCDVENPLIGENGAARVFGPQKGATPEMVKQLEAGLKHLTEIVKKQLGKQIGTILRGGAAGGLAAGTVAFMNAKLVSGIETILEKTGFYKQIKKADWVITGEGQFDRQSLQGKVVSGVTKAAKQNGVKVAVIAGKTIITEEQWRVFGINTTFELSNETFDLTEAIKNVRALLAEAAKKFALKYLLRQA